jgi:hypothetical protein
MAFINNWIWLASVMTSNWWDSITPLSLVRGIACLIAAIRCSIFGVALPMGYWDR